MSSTVMKQILTKHFQAGLLLFVFVIISETGDNSDITRVERRVKADERDNKDGANCSLAVLWRLMEYKSIRKMGIRGRGAYRVPVVKAATHEERSELLRNCSEHGQDDELSITSLTALCHAQCTANCEDLDVRQHLDLITAVAVVIIIIAIIP